MLGKKTADRMLGKADTHLTTLLEDTWQGTPMLGG